jgi:hypothetical protein
MHATFLIHLVLFHLITRISDYFKLYLLYVLVHFILGIFLFTTASRTALGPTQPPIQWVAGALSLGVKRTGPEADHSPPSNAEIKE